MDLNLTPAEQLLIEHACRRVVLETTLTVDRQDYAALAKLFTPDAVLVRPDGRQLNGRTAIEQAYAQRDPDRLTRHLITNHLVTLHEAGRASSHCYVLVWSGRHSDTLELNGRRADATEILGESVDQLVLTGEGWRIRERLARFTLYRSA